MNVIQTPSRSLVSMSAARLIFTLQSLPMPQAVDFVLDVLPSESPIDPLAHTSTVKTDPYVGHVLVTVNRGVVSPWKVGVRGHDL
jgi:hypothetical protein